MQVLSLKNFLIYVLEAIFSTSNTKRVTALKELIASNEVEDPLCFRNLSRIRWTARAESIKSVWNSFEAILDCLDSLRRNNLIRALGKQKRTRPLC